MFRIKICGVTTVDDALAAVAAGADALGLNFYQRSSRYVTAEQARRIVEVLPVEIVKVGVFVNASKVELLDIVRAVGLNVIQLHGDEPPALINELAPYPVIRALRCGSEGIDAVVRFLAACRTAGRLPEAVLLDAAVGHQFGGTGAKADWVAAQQFARWNDVPPLILAGGLTAENVAEAIATVGPAAVDTASGVESSPGRKASAKMQSFVQSARAAFGKLAQAR